MHLRTVKNFYQQVLTLHGRRTDIHRVGVAECFFNRVEIDEVAVRRNFDGVRRNTCGVRSRTV